MLLPLPIMLCCSALKIHLLCSISKNRNCQIYMQLCMSYLLHVVDNFIKTVSLEYINKKYQSIPLCSIIQ